MRFSRAVTAPLGGLRPSSCVRFAAPAIEGEGLPLSAVDPSLVDTPRRSLRIPAGLGLDRFSGVYLWILFIVVFGIWTPSEFLTIIDRARASRRPTRSPASSRWRC